MLNKEQKEEIIAEVLQNATVKMFSEAELRHTVDNINNILDSTLAWIDGAMIREMYDFAFTEERKKLGLELLNMIIKKRIGNG